MPAPRDTSDVDAAVSGFCSPAGLASSVDPPGDFTVDGSLAAQSASEAVASFSESGPEETSPIGPSVLIATRLPGYLKPCEISVQQVLLFVFLFPFLTFSFFFAFISNLDFFFFFASIFHLFRFSVRSVFYLQVITFHHLFIV